MDDKYIQIRDNIANAAERLAHETRAMDDQVNTACLNLLLPRLKQGLVRVAVIGATSSGKSTLINALLHRFVVPENPNVSSPIPVWIGYDAVEEPAFTIFERQEQEEDGIKKVHTVKTLYSAEKFLTRYCYNINDTIHRDRSRFEPVEYGTVSVDSPCLKGGAVLIDTLGISASKLDTAKTHAVLEEGVDLVLFVSSNGSGSNSYTNEDVNFLRTDIMGLNPDKRQVSHPVMPENIFFVHNNFRTDVPPSMDAMDENLDRVLAGVDKDRAQEIKNHNVFFVQALMGRYDACGGAYPYVQYAPAGCAADELDDLKERELYEITSMSKIPMGQKREQSGMEALETALAGKVKSLLSGGDSAAIHRIEDLIALANSVQDAAANRLSYIGVNNVTLQNTRDACASQKAVVTQEKKNIKAALSNYSDGFLSALHSVYGSAYQKISDQVEGELDAMPFPDELIRWTAFRDSSDQQKTQHMALFLPDVVQRVQKICTKEILNLLEQDSLTTSPLQVLNESQKFITREAETMKNITAALRDGGADKLGVLLPQEVSINALCGRLKSELEAQLKAAISDTLSSARDKYSAQISRYVQNVRWNFLLNFIPHGKKAFWKKIQKEVLSPLAAQLLDQMKEFTKPTGNGISSPLARAVEQAYDEVREALQEDLSKALWAAESRLMQIDEQITAGQVLSAQEQAKIQVMQQNCKAIGSDLIGWETQLLKGM